MVHLIKNKNGSFDAVTVSKGKLTWHTSPQQYNRRSGALSAIRSGMKSFGSTTCYFQDDTTTPSVVYILFEKGKPEIVSNKKASKPYIPNKK